MVSGDLETPLRIPWKHCITLREAVADLQGRIVSILAPEIPKIYFDGGPSRDETSAFAVRPVICGWSGGVVPARDHVDFSLEEETFTPAGVLAGALGVSEAFQFTRGDNPLAGNRSPGVALWSPQESNQWRNVTSGPPLEVLPAKLWLIGLGHLGQAYLWTLGFLPYQRMETARLVLQDIDALEDANDSTSLLTHRELVGIKKTRAMSAWCEERGFETNLIERVFVADFKTNDDEPRLALCGVDNRETRSALEKAGFKRIFEAGLGKDTQEYLSFQVHSFPASRTAENIWGKETSADANPEDLIQRPAYQSLQSKGMDRCGLIQLAGHSVGASFVGAVSSTLVVAEVLRLVHGNNPDEVIDGDLRGSSIVSTIVPNQIRFEIFQPGDNSCERISLRIREQIRRTK